MSTRKSNLTLTNLAAKKLLGKAHTSNIKDVNNEALPSNVSVASEGVFSEAIPNAPKIAFTGTPLIQSEKTKNEFGTYIDTYTIEQSVKDGSTVQIIYEGREAKTKVTGEENLDQLFDQYFSDKTDEEKLEIKRKYGTR